MECGQLCLAEADCYSFRFEESVLPSLETVCSLGGFHISSDVSTAQLCYVSGELLYLCDVLHLLVSSSIMKFTFWSLSFFVCYDRMVRASIGKALHATYSLLGSWLRGNRYKKYSKYVQTFCKCFFRSHLMSTLSLQRLWSADIPHVIQCVVMASCCLISIMVFIVVLGTSLSYLTNLMMVEPIQEFTGIVMKLMPANLPTLVPDSLKNSNWTITDGTSFL